jgi:predicted nucleic acid-binding protein
MFILDTDTLSLWWRKQEKVAAKILAAMDSSAPLVITLITRIEVLNGRFASILKAATGADLITAVSKLAETQLWLSRISELSLDESAIKHFDRLRAMKRLNRIGLPDLLIACIALAHDATLVTRNRKDFQSIPNLRIENWAD